MDKIEPLVIGDALFASTDTQDGERFFRVVHDCHSREQFAALIRWGAAALAQTHPSRKPRPHHSRTELPHTDGKYEGARHLAQTRPRTPTREPCTHKSRTELPGKPGEAVCDRCGENVSDE